MSACIFSLNQSFDDEVPNGIFNFDRKYDFDAALLDIQYLNKNLIIMLVLW